MSTPGTESPEWGKYAEAKGPFEGFPFSVAFPYYYGTYEIIMNDGSHHYAEIDRSTQYRAEGLRWDMWCGQGFSRHLFVAWKRVEEPPKDRICPCDAT